MTIARFMVLPGAVDLLEAFAAIPPGKLRESAVLHVRAIAETYSDAPAAQHMPDPLLMAAQGQLAPVVAVAAPAAAKALDGPRKGQIKTEDPQVTAVELMMRGVSVHDAADQTGLTFKEVFAARKAGRLSGLKFPDVRSKAHSVVIGSPRFVMSAEGIPDKALSAMENAARKRGIGLESYMARRRLALEMGKSGRHIRAITKATKESKATLSNWFHNARQAGHHVPYMIDNAQPSDESNVKPVEAPAQVIDFRPKKGKSGRGRSLAYAQKTFALTMEDYAALGTTPRAGIERGAKLMDTSVEEFLRRRYETLTLLARGKTPIQIAKTLNVSPKQVNNWRTRARETGVYDAFIAKEA
jgi:transposase